MPRGLAWVMRRLQGASDGFGICRRRQHGSAHGRKTVGRRQELIVHDLRPAALEPLTRRQARAAASPRAVADQCEMAFVSLPTLDTLRSVVLGTDGVGSGRAVKTVVNTCTVGVPLVEELEGPGGERHRPRRLPHQRRSARGTGGDARRHDLGRSGPGRKSAPLRIELGSSNGRWRSAGARPGIEAHQQYPFRSRTGGDLRGLRHGGQGRP